MGTCPDRIAARRSDVIIPHDLREPSPPMTHTTLHDLYVQHRGKLSDKWSSYLREYDRLFSSLRDARIRLLEIGIQNGGSLEIWGRYFPAATHIVGCDIDPACAALKYDDTRVSVVIGDANTDAAEAAIVARCSEFDVVIDDGSHRSGDVVRSFARYFARLADGGLFVAEDLHCSYWQAFQGGLLDPTSSIEFFKRLADLVNHEHWGVDRSRKSLIESFLRTYEFDLTEELLARVHSVEFVNSICVIRRQAAASNELGERFAVGSEESVARDHLLLRGTRKTAPDERENPWSSRTLLPEDAAIAESKRLSDAQESMSRLQSSLAQTEARVSELQSTLRRVNAEYAALNARFDDQVRQLKAERLQPHQAASSLAGRLTSPWRMLQALNHARLDARRRRRKAAATAADDATARDYLAWLRQYDTIDGETRSAMRRCIETMTAPPVISVLMPTYNANPIWLRAAIDSVRNQIYPHWELCISDDASTSAEAHKLLRACSEEDSRIKVVFRPRNGHISAASNSALSQVTGEWIALMDHDDLLPEHALFWVARAISQNPHIAMIYSDEDKIDEAGRRSTPYFKSDWNPDLFYSHNMFSHLGVYRSELVRRVGGFREGFEGAQDYDLALRCMEQIPAAQIHHIPKVLYHWRIHGQSTARSLDAKPYAEFAGEKALNEHFIRRGVRATSKHVGHGYRTRYALPVDLPLVSLIISAYDGLVALRRCISSVTERTRYRLYEIIVVEHGSNDPAVLAYLEQMQARGVLRVVRDGPDVNHAALKNRAVEQADGEIVGLLDCHIEITSSDWLSEMVSIALQSGVGAVGARLWCPDKTLKHGGILLGVGGVASPSHHGLRAGDSGYFSRAVLLQSFSAVTADCLIVAKEHYLAVGGLNEADLAFTDVDFCLRLREHGLRTVWTPYAELIHHGCANAPVVTPQEERPSPAVAYMNARWGELLRFDPAYNPNLTLDSPDYTLAWPPRRHRGIELD